MPGDLKIGKKTNKQTNKKPKSSSTVPVVQKMAMRGAIYQGPSSCSNVGYRYPSDKSLSSGYVIGKPIALSHG